MHTERGIIHVNADALSTTNVTTIHIGGLLAGNGTDSYKNFVRDWVHHLRSEKKVPNKGGQKLHEEKKPWYQKSRGGTKKW